MRCDVELPIFIISDATGGVSAYHDRKTLDAAAISAEDGPHLAAYGADGERLVLTVTADRWQIAPAEPQVFDIELLRDLLFERLEFWYQPAPGSITRDRIVERAAAYFKVREPPSQWQVIAERFGAFLFSPRV